MNIDTLFRAVKLRAVHLESHLSGPTLTPRDPGAWIRAAGEIIAAADDAIDQLERAGDPRYVRANNAALAARGLAAFAFRRVCRDDLDGMIAHCEIVLRGLNAYVEVATAEDFRAAERAHQAAFETARALYAVRG